MTISAGCDPRICDCSERIFVMTSLTGTGVHEILGQVQHYSWGDRQFLPDFLGRAVDGRPWAEWWLGTHPHAPAHLRDGRALTDIAGDLPFLVKVLAASRPLSLQVHPTATQAATGFTTGRYADPHPKPELIHALTEFEAVCGLRPLPATVDLLHYHGLTELGAYLTAHGIATTLGALLTGTFDPRPSIAQCHALAASAHAADPIRWVASLAQERPGDPAALATVLLQYVRLAPGQALRLNAGTPHAYLRGAGVEIMGPSDNVVRCGLTDKKVDIATALEIIDPTPTDNPVLPADAPHDLPVLGISLKQCAAGTVHEAQSPRLALTSDGRGWYLEPGARAHFEVSGFVAG